MNNVRWTKLEKRLNLALSKCTTSRYYLLIYTSSNKAMTLAMKVSPEYWGLLMEPGKTLCITEADDSQTSAVSERRRVHSMCSSRLRPKHNSLITWCGMKGWQQESA
ncbi:hypothetical protein GDO81_009424 [Engystomops pustulosus]|uniref:Uncharacterized protein n=1 Tax=Engystomops pustulosus TaxID=76066 RepID=A0AAV7BR32_ENGPU|nr:hypothetical protein GDO81_009424 [Engystomops pustulosus]